MTFSDLLLRWYPRHKRDLPWRNRSDPYPIWISEIMLQQTRVAAVIPYYERFLARFPTVGSLAEAPEQDLLTAWAGLGYYSRARNLQRGARQIVEAGEFPRELDTIRQLSGVGEYTAAAVGSIAFGIPEAAIDGNVIRVLSRVTAEPGEVSTPAVRDRLRKMANTLLPPDQPGEFNQAMMELGATLCTPTQPQCLLCPIASLCEAHRQGRQREFPIKKAKKANREVEQSLLVIRRDPDILLWQRAPESRRLAGFWELPDQMQFPKATIKAFLGEFRHTVVTTNYRIQVFAAAVKAAEPGFVWQPFANLHEIPLSTTARKALACSLK